MSPSTACNESHKSRLAIYRKKNDEGGVQIGGKLNDHRNTKSQPGLNSAPDQTIVRVMMVLNELGVVELF